MVAAPADDGSLDADMRAHDSTSIVPRLLFPLILRFANPPPSRGSNMETTQTALRSSQKIRDHPSLSGRCSTATGFLRREAFAYGMRSEGELPVFQAVGFAKNNDTRHCVDQLAGPPSS